MYDTYKQHITNAFITTLLSLLLLACSGSDDAGSNTSNFIPNVRFDTGSLINTNLPEYSTLQFPNNFIVLNQPYGVNGVVLFYAGSNNYSAFELTDPNHAIESCSRLTVNGVIASCNCDDGNSYDILSGIPQTGTTGRNVLKRYRVEVNGPIIRVFN